MFILQDSVKPSDKNHFHSAHIKSLVSNFELLTDKDILIPDTDSISWEIFFVPPTVTT